MESTSPEFEGDKFFVNQKRMSFKEKYYVYDEGGRELFYVERPFMFLGRRNITLFKDDSKTEPMLFINQVHFWEIFHRDYEVADANGQIIARLSRNNFTSLFRRAWNIVESKGTVTRAREDSWLSSILRRIVDFIPLVELVGGIFRTNFHLLAVDSAGNERKIGAFNRRFSIFDKYVLDLTEDPERHLDRRVALAVGILLDTAEKR